MQFIYNNFEVVNEKHILKKYSTFDEIIILKACKNSGFECITKKRSSSSEISRVSSSRAKSKIRDFALMNDFEFFYTQTINSNYDRFNLEEFKQLILKKFKAYKRINNNFIYLIIFEKHKNGAFHLHGLIGGVGVDLQKNVNGYDTLNFFADIGFNSLSKIKDKERVSNYILKYISKDITKTLSGYSYFHSKGLKFPTKEETYVDNFDNLELIYENSYLKKFKRKE